MGVNGKTDCRIEQSHRAASTPAVYGSQMHAIDIHVNIPTQKRVSIWFISRGNEALKEIVSHKLRLLE
jgi:hypothetical protein